MSDLLFAKTASIFEVRKNITMYEGDEIFHDYYINAGAQDGVKAGMKITVQRSIPFRDTGSGQISEDLMVDVAVVEILHVQKTFSVARRLKVTDAKKAPILDYNNLMLGDRIDLSQLGNQKNANSEGANNSGLLSQQLPSQEPASASSYGVSAFQDPNLVIPVVQPIEDKMAFAAPKEELKVKSDSKEKPTLPSETQKQPSLETNTEFSGPIKSI